MKRVDPRVLQRAIDALLDPAAKAHAGRRPRPLPPCALPCPRRRRRRVHFGVKFVRSIPHRDDEERQPPVWTLFPASTLGDGGVEVYNDSDEEVEERIYLANVEQNLHIAAIHRLVNAGADAESDSDGDGDGGSDASSAHDARDEGSSEPPFPPDGDVERDVDRPEARVPLICI